MIELKVDIGDVATEFALSQEATDGMLTFVSKEMTAILAKNWASQAKLVLKGTRQEYLQSLVVVDSGKFEGQVVLKGVVPNMIENGADAFDMKLGFSRSQFAHRTAKGWYFTVPFRFATPGAIGESSAFSGVLPPPVYREVKAQGTLRSVPSPYNVPKVRKEIVTTSKAFEEYKHKSSIYLGLKKVSKFYEKGKSSQYISFRRVSNNSDSNSWIHKGMQAQNLAEKAIAATNIPAEVDRLTDIYLKNLGF